MNDTIWKTGGEHMQVFAKSDIGRERKTNEDFYYVSKPEDKIRLFILVSRQKSIVYCL